MMRFFTATAVGLLAASASAQTFSYPRVWCYNPPLQDVVDYNQYRAIIKYSTQFGLHNPTTNPGDPTVAASEIFGAIHDQTTNGHPDNGVLLIRVGTDGMPLDATHTDTGSTSLYAHSGDAIENPTYATVPLPHTWTPWKDSGIAAAHAWMQDFVDKYKEIQSTTPGTPRPIRFFFDDEVMVIGDDFSEEQVEAYWKLLKDDSRFNQASLVLVPGTGKNLYALWDEAGRPEFERVTSGPDWTYRGKSFGNQRWWNWWSGVCRASIAGAMDAAYYSVIRSEWTTTPDPGFSGTGTVPLCSDYDGSLRLDSVANPEFGSRISNGFRRKDYVGSLNGGIADRIVWDAPGSNVVQSPSIYAGFTWYHWGYYNPALASPDTEVETNPGFPFTSGAATDDDWASYLGSAPQEAWSTVSLRNNRFALDGLHRSTNGRTTPIVPWVPMANQMIVIESIGTHTFRGITYGNSSVQKSDNVPVHTSARNLTRILAQCRARGVNELLEWNPGSYNAPPFYSRYNYGPDSQYNKNWNYFNEAVNNVWGYKINSTYMDAGATAVVLPPAGHPQYGLPAADLIRESDLSYSNTYTGRVRIDSLTGASGSWFVVKFDRDANLAAPNDTGHDYLEIDIEAMATSNAECYLYIRGENSSTWTSVTDGGTVDHWGNSIRNSPFLLPANRTARIHARVPYNSSFFSGGPCHLALSYLPATHTGTVSVWTDLVQLYGVHDVRRPAGDINGDYVADFDDRDMLYDLIGNSGHRKTPTDVAAADINHDGFIDVADYMFYVGSSAHYNDPADDDVAPSFEHLGP